MIAVAPERLRKILCELNCSVECLNVQIQIEFLPPVVRDVHETDGPAGDTVFQ